MNTFEDKMGKNIMPELEKVLSGKAPTMPPRSEHPPVEKIEKRTSYEDFADRYNSLIDQLNRLDDESVQLIEEMLKETHKGEMSNHDFLQRLHCIVIARTL